MAHPVATYIHLSFVGLAKVKVYKEGHLSLHGNISLHMIKISE